MARTIRPVIGEKLEGALAAGRQGWHLVRTRGPGRIQFWFIALAVGIVAGFAALFFRKGIEALQSLLYGTEDPSQLHSFAATLPWFVILLIPVGGGLAVGGIMAWLTPDRRIRNVADVIEGAALRKGRVEKRAGLASVLCSFITLSTGGSTGREGPVVHMAAVISSWVCARLDADGLTGRDLMGCAVAAAVSASFNAPIAGALFALEVVLRHFAMHAFAPIVIASAAGTVINRLEYGGVTEFVLSGEPLGFYAELPAFLLLGFVSGLVAVAMMRAIWWADDIGTAVQRRIRLPLALRPALAGALVGALAIAFPHVIGVGYETTSKALTGGLALHEAIVFAMIKTVAVAITLAGRMGGGVFSPSLMMGALTGLAFGLIATGVFPDLSGDVTLYALAGMGAVAAAVLGAPISTTLIVFELTGDWETGLAVMVSVSISTAVAARLVHRSFFLTQLARRGVHLAKGPQAYLLAMMGVARVMRPADSARAAPMPACRDLVADGLYLRETANLEMAMPMFEESGAAFIPVLARAGEEARPEIVGALFHVDALRAYNEALAATAAEEHS